MKFCLKIAPLVLLVGICMQLTCAAPISNTAVDTVSDVEDFDFAGTASGEENLYTGTSTGTLTESESYDEHREADEAIVYTDAEIDSEAEEIEEPQGGDVEEETVDDIHTEGVEETDDDIVETGDFEDDE